MYWSRGRVIFRTNSTSRNKFCFTGGYIETSVQLPGASNVLGLWPAIWTMGNLGRAGYGASLEGMVCQNFRDFFLRVG